MAEFLATCTLGLEEPLRDELSEQGITRFRVERGRVRFRCDLVDAYRATLWTRIATRVQQVLLKGTVRSREDWYDLVRAHDWRDSVGRGTTLSVSASVKDAALDHSGFAALVVKDAICDQTRERVGVRPDVDKDDPDLPVIAVLHGDEAEVSRSLSGDSLHRRGWRPKQHKSPLNEALAAGLLRLSGWDRRSPLVDPMCGSGTFLVEAAHWALDRAPALDRGLAFERWPDLEHKAWRALQDEAAARAKKSLEVEIHGADPHPGSMAMTNESLRAAEVPRGVTVTQARAKDWVPPVPPAWVVTNPPYGVRLGEGAEVEEAWAELGLFLRTRCPGARAFVLSGDKALTAHLHLKAERRFAVMNGPLDCRWVEYRIRP